MKKTIDIANIIKSKSADDDQKGNLVFKKIKEECKGNEETIFLDFEKIELLNTAFLNNAIGQLFNKNEFDLSTHSVKIINIDKSMIDLLEETIKAAKMKY